MLKIKDESGKVLFTVTDESIEPAPTECMECGCPTPAELAEVKKEPQKEEKK